jgi:[ribosomal protein S5]-alanine N-acetyltransferase
MAGRVSFTSTQANGVTEIMHNDDGRLQDRWRLRRAGPDDVDGLHALACLPSVYRYLFDGVAPARTFVAQRVAQSVGNPATSGLGMWILEGQAEPHAGCVELRPYAAPRSAELTYLLQPRHWGRGLAVRMAWTAVIHAFRSGHIDAVVAGADRPNGASFAVMRRLGMRFHKSVQYPLGAGAEYVLHRGDPGPTPAPLLLPLV